MTTFLLDINVLLALSDQQHIHYGLAHRWFEANKESWATCPITENGFLRISSQPHYPSLPGDFPAVLAILRQSVSASGHEFWADSVSIMDTVEPGVFVTPSQITDVYLLGLAAQRGGKLATLDTRMPVHAVRGGREAIEFLTE